MNERIKELAEQAGAIEAKDITNIPRALSLNGEEIEKFAELLIEAVLDQVKERAYYTGDRDWRDEVDRPWIQLEFGYGSLADAKKGIFK